MGRNDSSMCLMGFLDPSNVVGLHLNFVLSYMDRFLVSFLLCTVDTYIANIVSL